MDQNQSGAAQESAPQPTSDPTPTDPTRVGQAPASQAPAGNAPTDPTPAGQTSTGRAPTGQAIASPAVGHGSLGAQPASPWPGAPAAAPHAPVAASPAEPVATTAPVAGVAPAWSQQPGTPPPPAGPTWAQPAQPGASFGVPQLAGAPDPAARPSRRHRGRTAVALLACGGLGAGLVLGGVLLGIQVLDQDSTGLTSRTGDGSGGTGQSDQQDMFPDRGSLPGMPGDSSGSGTGQDGSGRSSGTTTSGSTLDVTAATDAQQQGVVVVESVLGYQSAESAGTGVVLTSDGLVVTNNHVIEGATEIRVTVPQTGRTYTATVVGTDATADIAVLELTDASGLEVATLDDDGDPAVGDEVTAVGNAGGTGTLVAATGTVTALDQSITAQSEGASSGESLSGLIEIDADVVSGDSGGALLDSEGEVVGITTAASSGSADITGYAIDIDDAMTVVEQITSGIASDTVTLGYPAFLGVQVSSASTGRALPGAAGSGVTGSGVAGATVAGVVEGSPAAEAGLSAGDTITAVGGVAVTSAADLTEALSGFAPGDQVDVAWTTTDGSTTAATVTLIAGPAD